MKAAQWGALAVGAGLGMAAGCFTAPELTGPYQCSQQGACSDPDLSCVAGVCCKYDGGQPECPPPPPPPDGGEPDGSVPDAGCQVPSPSSCTVAGQRGSCASGEYSCDGGVLRCVQMNFPDAEVCNGLDDDCDGVVDPYPRCGGPQNLLAPDADYATVAMRTSSPRGAAPNTCLLDYVNATPDGGSREYLDGGDWRAVGATTHFIYSENDGGLWDLSKPGQSFVFAFTGNMVNPASPPIFNTFFQPEVLLCGPGGWRRYQTTSNLVLSVTGNTFSINTGFEVANPLGGQWTIATTSGPLFDLKAIQRVEMWLEPRNSGTSPPPAFDAGVTVFGFFPP